MPEYLRSATLLFFLLNPFLVIIYLVDLIDKLAPRQFAGVLIRAALIAGAVFCCFAILGDAVFSVMQAEFASFQIFGGVIFLLIAIQFVFRGPAAIEILRSDSAHLASAVAMPVLIGPGTISASVIVGKRNDPFCACLIVVFVVLASVVLMYALKLLHDYVRPRHARLVQWYVEIAGRITALYVGTVSVEMIMQGIRAWVQKF